MKNKRIISRQIIVFLVITSFINAVSMLGWFASRSWPVLRQLDSFKTAVSFELEKEYSTVAELKKTLNTISNNNLVFKVEDASKNIIAGKETGITLFSDITKIDGEVYLVTFMTKKNINFTKVIIECCVFQIIEVTLLLMLTYLFGRRKIIKPIDNIIEDIRDYKFGRKPKRNEINSELDLIQNEFVNLTEQLDEEKKEQNRIIASISHDIKTPLTSIIGYADLIDGEEDIEVVKKYNSKISNKALHLKDVLSSFDDYLVNYDKMSLKLTKVSIEELVAQLNNDYKIELENNGIDFKIITDLDKEVLEVDALKLKRVFSNLISNSTRYVLDHGKIVIKILKEDNYFKFIVSDNGRGINSEIIDKIFAPFYTTDKSRKISGLGLSICREFIEMYGGTIKAYNDKGFTIEFTLPERQEI